MIVHKKILIKGKVQGVFFRASAKEQAENLGVMGEVKNLPHETVHVIAEGEEDAVTAFIEWCNHGPDRALVEEVIVEDGAIKGYKDFKVIRF